MKLPNLTAERVKAKYTTGRVWLIKHGYTTIIAIAAVLAAIAVLLMVVLLSRQSQSIKAIEDSQEAIREIAVINRRDMLENTADLKADNDRIIDYLECILFLTLDRQKGMEVGEVQLRACRVEVDDSAVRQRDDARPQSTAPERAEPQVVVRAPPSQPEVTVRPNPSNQPVVQPPQPRPPAPAPANPGANPASPPRPAEEPRGLVGFFREVLKDITERLGL